MSTEINPSQVHVSNFVDSYEGHDYYLMDELLTEEHKLIRQTAADNKWIWNTSEGENVVKNEKRDDDAAADRTADIGFKNRKDEEYRPVKAQANAGYLEATQSAKGLTIASLERSQKIFNR